MRIRNLTDAGQQVDNNNNNNSNNNNNNDNENKKPDRRGTAS